MPIKKLKKPKLIGADVRRTLRSRLMKRKNKPIKIKTGPRTRLKIPLFMIKKCTNLLDPRITGRSKPISLGISEDNLNVSVFF
jgi:hypothetical protein